MFDIEKSIEDCKKKKKENESICFSFGVGRMMPLPFDSKKIKKGMQEGLEYIKKLEGFQGVNPVDLWHTILIFDSLNNAKKAKNLLEHKGISTGNYVVPLIVENQYLKGCSDGKN